MTDSYERWWLVTWTTYGTWLPGDPRGFRTWRGGEYIPPPKRYAKPDEPAYDGSGYKRRHALGVATLAEEPVELNRSERVAASEAMGKECGSLPLKPSILVVGNVHVHLLVCVGSYSLRIAAGRLKAAASRRFQLDGFPQSKVWCHGCHLNSKDTERES